MKEKLERVRNYLSNDLNYIETVSINKKETLYDLLECWMKLTKKETIGDLNKYNRNTTRIKVKIGSKDYKINSFLCDYSVSAPPINVEGHTFIKKFLGTKINSEYITLENWMNTYVPNEKDMILQMDIEGSEYDVLLDVQNNLLDKFRIIIIEFHHFSQILTPLGFKMMNLVFDKLLKIIFCFC